MKLKYLMSLAIAGTAMLTGCKKDFLEAEPSEFITPEQLGRAAAQDPALLDGSIAGLYTTMFTPGMGGTTGHDDFGQKALDIYTDMLSSDMVLAGVNYGWYDELAALTSSEDFTRIDNYMPFRYLYRQVFGANTVIDVLGGNDAVPDTQEGKYTMGQAKAMRAYAYFYLTQMYAKEYGNGTEKILPIYTTTDTRFMNAPKSTAAEVWNLMEADLTEAVELLNGFNRASKDQVDQNVAKGLLVYVLSSRGTTEDWTKVRTLTQEIMAAYPKTTAEETVAVVSGGVLTNPKSGFNNVATPSWMWGVDLTLSQGIDLLSWWGQVDYFTYSYASVGDYKTIDKGLYDAIRADDIRKKQFHATVGIPWNKFFDPARKAQGQREVTTDLIYMRADEFYLLNAEANARLGNEPAAKDVLSDYLADRITDVTYIDALAGQALLNEIYLQTRIELWGEGKAYLALKRNKATATRGSNHIFHPGQSFSYNDSKLTMEIPQAEVLNNPNLNN